ERHDFVPSGAPQLRDGGVLLAPALLEGVERGGGIGLGGGAVNGSKVASESLAVDVRDEAERGPDDVDDARLDDGEREGGVNGFGEALEAVAADEEEVLPPPVFQVGHNGQPDSRPLARLDP